MNQMKETRTSKVRMLSIATVLCGLLIVSWGVIGASEGGWELLDSGTTHVLHGVCFVNNNIGTAVGGTYQNPLILRTNDSGDHWYTQMGQLRMLSPPQEYADFWDVSFVNANTGMAVGYYGTIFYTHDGGIQWTQVAGLNPWNTYYGCHMVNDMVGYAVGVTNIFSPLVTKTTDGWQTTESYGFLIEYEDVWYEADLTDVYFIDALSGYATAYVCFGQGAIMHTSDGGETWELVHWDDYHGLIGLDFPSDTVGYAVGEYGHILKTSNGGTTWDPLVSGTGTRLWDVSFATENVGMVVSDFGRILKTTDGGTTWSLLTIGVVSPLHGIDLVDQSTAFAVGEDGTILRTTTGGVPQAPPEQPAKPSGRQFGFPFRTYTYTTSTIDPNGDDVYYLFDWGDCTNTSWIGPYASGEPISDSYAWTSPGIYQVRVKAKDIHGNESPWSDILYVRINRVHVQPHTLSIGPD